MVNKSNRFEFRFEDEIAEWFKKEQSQLKITKTEIIRRLIRGQKSKLKLTKIDTDILQKIVISSTKIGVNLNQISYHFNSQNKKEINPLSDKKKLEILEKKLELLEAQNLEIVFQISEFVKLASGQKRAI